VGLDLRQRGSPEKEEVIVIHKKREGRGVLSWRMREVRPLIGFSSHGQQTSVGHVAVSHLVLTYTPDHRASFVSSYVLRNMGNY
jgi:hypothetical protein